VILKGDTDPALVNEILVGPVIARIWSGAVDGLDPTPTSRQLVDILYTGIAAG
jgi:hypothetical protein